MLSSYCGQILSCLPVCSALKVHLRFANTKSLNPLQAKSPLTSTGAREVFIKRPDKKILKTPLSETSSTFLKAIQLFHNPNLFNNRSKSYLILQNSSSLQFLKCRAKYQIVSLVINGKLNRDFDQQDALILQLQASFEDISSSEQSDVVH